MKNVVKTIIRQALLVGVLGVLYYGIYWYSGVWEIPIVGFSATLLVLGSCEVVEYRQEKEKDKEYEKNN